MKQSTSHKGVYYDKRGKLCVKFSFEGKPYFKRRTINEEPFLNENHALEARKEYLAKLAADTRAVSKSNTPLPITFLQGCRIYRSWRKQQLKKTTSYGQSKAFIKHVEKYFDKNLKIIDMTQFDFDCWRNYMNSLEFSVHHKNLMLRRLCLFFDFLKVFYELDIKYPYRLNRFRDDRPKPKYKKITYSPEQLNLFLNNLPTKMLYTYFLTNYFTGLRPGEMRGLKIKDYDPVNRTFEVYRGVTSKLGENRMEEFSLKTDGSTRTVYIPDSVCDVLNDFIKHHHINPKQNSFLFHSSVKKLEACKPASENYLTYNKDKVTKNIGLPQIDLHEFRHSYGTYCSILEDGNLTSTSESMGHDNIVTTSKFYDHSGEIRKQNLACKLEGVAKQFNFSLNNVKG